MELSILSPFDSRHLDRAKALGLTSIQLRIGPGFPVSTEDSDLAEARKAADELRARGLRVVALGFYRNLLDPDRKVAARDAKCFRNALAMAGLLGPDLIGAFAGRHPEKTVEENIPLFVKTWKPLLEEAHAQGVRVAFENCTMYRGYPVRGINLSHSPAAYDAMYKALPEIPFGIEFDPSHCIKQRMDPVKFLRSFPGRVYNVHLKDHERLEDKEQLYGSFDVRCSRDRFPGFGQVDFAAIFKELKSQNYNGPFTIEAERDPEFSDEDDIKTALEKSIRLLRGQMPGTGGEG